MEKILVPDLINLRHLYYTEVSPDKREGFENGVFLFNIEYGVRTRSSIQVVKSFRLCALLNRDYYTLAKEAIFVSGIAIFSTRKVIKNLIREISDRLLFSTVNFVRNPRVKVSDLPIPVIVLDILLNPIEGTRDPDGIWFEPPVMNYFRPQTIEEKRSVCHRDGLLNQLESRALVHSYLRNLEVEDDDHMDLDEVKLFLDALRKWSLDEFKEGFQLGLVQTPNPHPNSIFQVKIPPSLEYIDRDQYKGESDDICSICHEKLVSNCEGEVDLGQLARCKHVYHGDCVWNWILINLTCPICRSCCQTVLI